MTTHQVTCDVPQADCSGSWFAPGYVSSRSGCCHCSAGCASVNTTTCTYNDQVSEGSCYSMTTHQVTCNVAQAACSDSWFPPGFTSSRSGCCHCSASCSYWPGNASDTCNYHDAVSSPPPPTIAPPP